MKLPESGDKHIFPGCEGVFDDFEKGLDGFFDRRRENVFSFWIALARSIFVMVLSITSLSGWHEVVSIDNRPFSFRQHFWAGNHCRRLYPFRFSIPMIIGPVAF